MLFNILKEPSNSTLDIIKHIFIKVYFIFQFIGLILEIS